MSDLPSGGISVGDATLEFFADTTKLDAGIDSLNAKVTAGMAGAGAATAQFGQELDATGENADMAGEVIKDSMEKATYSVREAQGATMLLGEQFGVHLPRHVSRFVATLPGVGEAMSAAFSAVAILFIIEAVVKLTEKVTNFVSSAYIYTEQMKAADEAAKGMNAETIKQIDNLNAAKKALDDFGKSAHQLAEQNITDSLNKNLAEITANANKQIATLTEAASKADPLWKKILGYVSLGTTGTTTESIKQDAKNLADAILQIQKEAAKQASDAKKAADDQRLLQAEKEHKEEHDAEEKFQKEQEKLLKEYAWKRQEQVLAAGAEYNKTMEEMKNFTLGFSSTLPDLGNGLSSFTKHLIAASDAAHKFGIETKTELVTQLNEMKKAFAEMAASGIDTDTQQMKAFAIQITDLEKRIKEFNTVASPAKTNAFFEAFKKGGHESEAAMWGFGDAYGSAIAKVISGEEGLGQAMAAATKQFIGQIGARALVQGMFYLAQGIADTFWNPARAGADFAAAAEFLAIGGAATAAAGAIPGGGSGGGGAYGGGVSHPVQTTGQSSNQPKIITQAQHFAGGGLISSPTLAVLGDSPAGGSQSEAVLPLENEQAMSRIADAIAQRMSGGGGGSGHTFNMWGNISHSDLKKLAKRLSSATKAGTALLHASNTLRVTKRSA